MPDFCAKVADFPVWRKGDKNRIEWIAIPSADDLEDATLRANELLKNDTEAKYARSVDYKPRIVEIKPWNGMLCFNMKVADKKVNP